MNDKAGNEDLLVRYLLGELPDEEQTRIEQLFFTGDEYYEQLLALENELRYDYAQGKLSGSRREGFEKRFLGSPEDRKSAEVAGLLLSEIARTAAAGAPKPGPSRRRRSGWWPGLLPFIGVQNPAVGFGLAALAAVVVVGSMWLAFQTGKLRTQLGQMRAERNSEEDKLRRRSAEERARANEFAGEVERERNQREALEKQLARRQEQAPRQQSGKPELLRSVVSFVLVPGSVRGEGDGAKRLLVPPLAKTVRLQLNLKKESQYRSYRAALLTAEGAEIWGQDNLRARPGGAGQAVVLSLRAGILSQGDYELTLKGLTPGREAEDVASFYFSVVRK